MTRHGKVRSQSVWVRSRTSDLDRWFNPNLGPDRESGPVHFDFPCLLMTMTIKLINADTICLCEEITSVLTRSAVMEAGMLGRSSLAIFRVRCIMSALDISLTFQDLAN